jgi:hypothetical protein
MAEDWIPSKMDFVGNLLEIYSFFRKNMRIFSNFRKRDKESLTFIIIHCIV